ncbi:MAG TPA: hypothetical protein VKT77_10060 [Chthonomonadaceae bacterium]|nr:hypothetical protein [Chthonomonadaceae bacterium]
MDPPDRSAERAKLLIIDDSLTTPSRLLAAVEVGAVATAAFLLILVSAGQFAASGVSAFLLAAEILLIRSAVRRQREQAGRQLADMDTRLFGGLCALLEDPDPPVRDIAGHVLVHMLPRLAEADFEQLVPERRNCLYRRLSRRAAHRSAGLTIAILRALPHFATETALPYVARLAAASGWRANAAVTAAAVELLPILQERMQDRPARAEADAELDSDSAAPITEAEHAERARIDAAVDAAMADVEQAMRDIHAPAVRNGFVAAAWMVIVPCYLAVAWSRFAQGDWVLGVVSVAIAAAATQLYRVGVSMKHTDIANRLIRLDDVRVLGRLAELLEWPNPEIHRAVMPAMTRLLPKVKASDRPFRTRMQRTSFNRSLSAANAYSHPGYVIAALKALEQIGDASAVPPVTALANASPSSAGERKVCDAAAECLPYLLQRAKQTDLIDSLLRASAPSSSGPDTLMRAAATTGIEHEGLLRAAAGEES